MTNDQRGTESSAFPRSSSARSHRLAIGAGLYTIFALADIRMTVVGMEGIAELEGNPVMRTMMAAFGPIAGLWVEKIAVGVICFLLASYGEREIKRDAAWIYKVPSTRWARAWYRRGERSWIAFIPLYAAAVAQLLAAMSWVLV